MNSETAAKIQPPEISVSLQDPEWEVVDGVEEIVRKAALLALSSAMLPAFAMGRSLEISIVLANDDLIRILNNEYCGKDKATNVLSFATLDSEEPNSDGVLNLGDVILSYQTIAKESQEQGKFLLDHVQHMTVHGILHLLGYDHENEEDANNMEALEIRVLQSLGVQNPYTDTEYTL